MFRLGPEGISLLTGEDCIGFVPVGTRLFTEGDYVGLGLKGRSLLVGNCVGFGLVGTRHFIGEDCVELGLLGTLLFTGEESIGLGCA